MRCYLDIEQTRFRERLTVDMHDRSEDLGCPVTNSFLQPLVENAIQHGIAPRRSPGRIIVRAQRLNGSLRVEIKTTDAAYLRRALRSPALAQTLARALARASDWERRDLSCLERFYPHSHLLQMRDAQEGGLVVMLEVPFETTREHGQVESGDD